MTAVYSNQNYLVLQHLGFLLQPVNLIFLVVDHFVLLTQLRPLIMDEILFGDEVAIQFLKHGLQHIGYEENKYLALALALEIATAKLLRQIYRLCCTLQSSSGGSYAASPRPQ